MSEKPVPARRPNSVLSAYHARRRSVHGGEVGFLRLPDTLQKHIHPEPNSGCWLWSGHSVCGYGYTSWPGKTARAHRVIYQILVGAIPAGLTLDHKCFTPACVNPDHLDVATIGENTRRYLASLTHCPYDHPKTPENTYHKPSGGIGCLPCMRVRGRKAYGRAGRDERERMLVESAQEATQ